MLHGLCIIIYENEVFEAESFSFNWPDMASQGTLEQLQTITQA